MKLVFSVYQHTTRETREKKQAVNPLESTDSACLCSHCYFLWSNGWGSGGSCGAAEGQLYITLLKVITEILKWNHSAARVCSNPLQRCLGRVWGLSEDLYSQRSFSPLPLVFFIIRAGPEKAPTWKHGLSSCNINCCVWELREGRGKVVCQETEMWTHFKARSSKLRVRYWTRQ